MVKMTRKPKVLWSVPQKQIHIILQNRTPGDEHLRNSALGNIRKLIQGKQTLKSSSKEQRAVNHQVHFLLLYCFYFFFNCIGLAKMFVHLWELMGKCEWTFWPIYYYNSLPCHKLAFSIILASPTYQFTSYLLLCMKQIHCVHVLELS